MAGLAVGAQGQGLHGGEEDCVRGGRIVGVVVVCDGGDREEGQEGDECGGEVGGLHGGLGCDW